MADLKNNLYLAQCSMGKLVQDAENAFFQNHPYATLKSVHDTINAPLAEYGIVIKHDIVDGQFITFATDGDETIEIAHMPYVEETNPHKIGSNITYFRRISLCMAFDLVPSDDDGNAGAGLDEKPVKESPIDSLRTAVRTVSKSTGIQMKDLQFEIEKTADKPVSKMTDAELKQATMQLYQMEGAGIIE